MYFNYGQKEIDYLKSKDKTLAEAIDRIGMVEREVMPNLFEALIYSIAGQQISVKANKNIWNKIVETLQTVDAMSVANIKADDLQKTGLTFRKVDYMQDIARKIVNKELDLNELYAMNDEQVCEQLSRLRGIGVWTAEMLMLNSMQRPNILSFGDLAIQRGLRMLYHHRAITPKLFKKYQRRYTPYASVASIYLWAISAGAIPEMRDYAPMRKK